LTGLAAGLLAAGALRVGLAAGLGAGGFLTTTGIGAGLVTVLPTSGLGFGLGAATGLGKTIFGPTLGEDPSGILRGAGLDVPGS
jgi:hypothetical protein